MLARGERLLSLYLKFWRQHYTCTCTERHPLRFNVEDNARNYDSIGYWNAVSGSLAVYLRWPRKCLIIDNYGAQFLQRYCPYFTGSARIWLCDYFLTDDAYTKKVMDSWKDQLCGLHLDVEVSHMFEQKRDTKCLHNQIPPASLVVSQSAHASLDVSRVIGQHVRQFDMCILPRFMIPWESCNIHCSQCHPSLRHLKVMGIFPRTILRRNPQVASLECRIETTSEYRSLIQELSDTILSGTSLGLQKLHLDFSIHSYVRRNTGPGENTVAPVNHGNITESIWTRMYGFWTELPPCPLLTQVSFHMIRNRGFPTHLLDKNPQVASVKLTYPKKSDTTLDWVVLDNALSRLLSPVHRNLTDLGISLNYFTVFDNGFPDVWWFLQGQLSSLRTLTITILTLGEADRLPTTLIKCASRTDIYQPREIVVHCKFEGSVCPMRLCLDTPPTGAGTCRLRTNIPITSQKDQTTDQVSCIRMLVVPMIDHLA